MSGVWGGSSVSDSVSRVRSRGSTLCEVLVLSVGGRYRLSGRSVLLFGLGKGTQVYGADGTLVDGPRMDPPRGEEKETELERRRD